MMKIKQPPRCNLFLNFLISDCGLFSQSPAQYICSSEQWLYSRASDLLLFPSLLSSQTEKQVEVWWSGLVVVSLTFPSRARHTLEVAVACYCPAGTTAYRLAWYKRSHRYRCHSCTLTVVASQTKHEILCKYFYSTNKTKLEFE